MRVWMFRLAVTALLGLAPLAVEAGVEANISVNANQTVHWANHTLGEIQTTVPPFAQMPPSGPNSSNYWGDAYDPGTIPGYIDLADFGDLITITASGEWDSGQPGSIVSGPEGNGIFTITQGAYAIMGVSQLGASLNTLVGVFTTDSTPNIGDVTPPILNTLLGDDMTNPLLNQAFAIGALLEGIHIPVGATRLYLGLHNSHAWTNAQGSVDVTVEAIPEPASLIVWGMLGAAGIAAYRRRRKREVATEAIA